MIEESKLNQISQQFEDLIARMQRPEQLRAMQMLMCMSEDEIRRSLDAYYSSPVGQAALGNGPEFRARVVAARSVASDVLGNENSVEAWLLSPIASLDGVTPLSCLHTDEGFLRVLNVLASIADGRSS